jgi:hypothetical protein
VAYDHSSLLDVFYMICYACGCWCVCMFEMHVHIQAITRATAHTEVCALRQEVAKQLLL